MIHTSKNSYHTILKLCIVIFILLFTTVFDGNIFSKNHSDQLLSAFYKT